MAEHCEHVVIGIARLRSLQSLVIRHRKGGAALFAPDLVAIVVVVVVDTAVRLRTSTRKTHQRHYQRCRLPAPSLREHAGTRGNGKVASAGCSRQESWEEMKGVEGWMKGSPRPWITALLLCVLVPGDAGLRRHTEDEAFFPLDVVVRQTETVLNAADGKRALSAQHLNRLAGSLALHGRFVAADRALAASLRLQPSQGDALYLLASLRCMASRLGEARDALFKGYHSRAVSNLHEVAAVNSDTCARLPLLFPADAVSHERSYPLFPHYSHTERFYITQRDPADELRRCAPPIPPSPRAGF
ncbi:MAG: hypothetical protein ACPIOQ_58095, partial [Promethearchaeia archaeon]